METVGQALCSRDQVACTQFTYLAMHKLSGAFSACYCPSYSFYKFGLGFFDFPFSGDSLLQNEPCVQAVLWLK